MGFRGTGKVHQEEGADDGELKQKGPTSDMIFKVPYLIGHISSFMTLTDGDVILTYIALQ
ncbi:putative acylpyruvase FAHD1 mitochondrial [Bienertia sinuspersici]